MVKDAGATRTHRANPKGGLQNSKVVPQICNTLMKDLVFRGIIGGCIINI